MYAKRRTSLLALLCVCFVFIACTSVPDVAPSTVDVIDTQAQVTESAVKVQAISENVEASAVALADDLKDTQYKDRADALAVKARELTAEASILKANVDSARKEALQYISDAEQAIKGKALAMLESEKYKGQRNSLALILAAIICLIAAITILRR